MTIFMSSFSSLQNFLIFLALVRYLQRDKRKGLLRMHQAAMILVHLCSQHWMQKVQMCRSAVLHLNPPKKRTKLSDITFSSGEEDEVLGNIHPSNKSKTTFLLEEDTNFDPGSPLDRSTPISEYENEETEAFSMTEKTENISPKNNSIISTQSTTVGCTSTAVSSNIPETSTSNQEPISEIQPSTSRNDTMRGKTPSPVNPRFR